MVTSLSDPLQGNANIVYHIYRQQASSPSRTEEDLHALPDVHSRTTSPPTSVTPPDSPLPANIDQEDDAKLDEICRTSLLRLRKSSTSTKNYALIYEEQQRLMAPLFKPEHIVAQTLVKLPDDLIGNLNENLKYLESTGSRPQIRVGRYLAGDEVHGMLVENMTLHPGGTCIELKPKWLLQSPSAPLNATSCRTCALRAMRQHVEPKKELNLEWCPLDLVEGTEKEIRHIVDLITSVTDCRTRQPETLLKQQMVALIKHESLLPNLRNLQRTLDPGGIRSILQSEGIPETFLIATALRDCTLFFRDSTQAGSANALVMKLGDLDIKEPVADKVQHWHNIELELEIGGWYLNKNSICRLSRAIHPGSTSLRRPP